MPARSASVAKDDAPEATGEARLADHWMQEIDSALKREETWRKRGKEVIKRYRDERDNKDATAKVNILWSNTEVLKAALYARTAIPDIRRRFPDAKRGNSAARYAAEVLERSIRYATDIYDIDTPVSGAVADMLLPGRGIAWVSYEPTIEGEEITEQKLCLDYVYWEDFTHGLARSWATVPWVARRHAMPKQEFQGRFPDHRPKRGVSGDYVIKDASGASQEAGDQETFVEVWEIWDKTRRRRVFVARGYDEVLQNDADPYGLRDFYPCPMPITGVTTTDTMRPEPEFCQYQDQANELDTLATRIRNLTEYMVWSGIYDASLDEEGTIKDAATGKEDGLFLPHKRFQELRDKGGIEAAFGFLPIDRIGPTVAQLRIDAEMKVQEIYQITGISDVIRGSTNPNETLGAQNLKAKFGSMRLQKRQREVQRFVRDLYRIMAEIVAEHFTVETLSAITQIDLPMVAEAPPLAPETLPMLPPPPPTPAAGAAAPGGAGLMNAGLTPPLPSPMPPPGQPSMDAPPMMGAPMPMQGAPPMGGAPMMPAGPPTGAPPMMQGASPQTEQQEPKATWPEVMAILRSDKLRGYRIDIETDSTLLEDAAVDKQDRVEFAAAFERMLQGAYVAATTAPMMLPLLKETALFLVRSYRPGRVMEEALEDAFEEVAKNPPPNPNAAPPAMPPMPEPMGEAERAKLMLEAQKSVADAEHKKALLHLDVARLDAEVAAKAETLRLERDRLGLEGAKAIADANGRAMERQSAAEQSRQQLAFRQEDKAEAKAIREQDRTDKGLPDGHAMRETAQAWQEQAGQLGQVLGVIVQRLDQQAQGLELTMQAVQTIERGTMMLGEAIAAASEATRALAEQMAAPVEIVRDASGRATGARKGAMTREVVRGPDGQVTGLQ